MNPILQHPIFAWCIFLGAMLLCACLMFAALDIEIWRLRRRDAFDRVFGCIPDLEMPFPPEHDFPQARVKDAPYNIIMAAADHKRQERR